MGDEFDHHLEDPWKEAVVAGFEPRKLCPIVLR
jgi:hypothetical protein